MLASHFKKYIFFKNSKDLFVGILKNKSKVICVYLLPNKSFKKIFLISACVTSLFFKK